MIDESDHIRETYAHYGLAVYMAQVLEHGLVNAMLVANLAGGGRLSPAEIDSFMDRRFEFTLGRLIKELRGHVTVDEELGEILSKALKTRNWLAHAYFRDRADDFMTVRGRNQMIEELESARELMKAADQALDAVVRPMRERIGLTDEKITGEYDRVFRELREADG